MRFSIADFRLPIVCGLLPIIGAVMGFVYAGAPKPGPTGEIEPVEVKPALMEMAKPWIIRNDTGVHVVAYYQHVTMPDGTRQELKIKLPTAKPGDPVPDILLWQALAQKQWDAQLAAEAAKPKPCSRCGGTGVEPQ